MNVLLCIGCNAYDDGEAFPPLRGAESDAERVYSALMEGGIYDVSRSRRLSSPRLSEVLGALEEVVFDAGDAAVLTLFFAGHGCVSRGGFYLALRDSVGDRLSVTSLSMAQLFRVIGEAQPRTVNIVIDACQAAGSVYDLHTLLNRDMLGKSHDSAIFFLGACTADQYASEDDSGGLATTALLRYVSGESRIQDGCPFLDLLELGQTISADVSKASPEEQVPTSWALGLYGYGVFARNPHYREDSTRPAYSVESISPSSPAGGAISKASERIWNEHTEIIDDWRPDRLHALMEQVLGDIGEDHESALLFLTGLARSLQGRTAGAQDIFAGAEAVGCAAIHLLPYLETEQGRALATELMEEWRREARSVAWTLLARLREDRFALLGSGLSEFYFLPQRVCKLLGWVGTLALVDEPPEEGSGDELRDLAELVLAQYSASVIALAERQAPWVYVFTMACKQRGWEELARRTLTSLCESAARAGGHFLSLDANPGDAFRYTLLRAGVPVPLSPKRVAQPSELLATLLLCAGRLGLDEEVDPLLGQLDHRWMNSFVPTTYLDFARSLMPSGENFTRQIGFGIWTLDDVRTVLGENVATAGRKAPEGLCTQGRDLCILGGLLLEDRVPYLLDDPASETASVGD